MKTASKRFAAWLFALALCLTLFLAAAVPIRAAGDSGITWNESDQRYEISDYAGLLEFAAIVNGTHPSISQNKSACAILTKDIDASASANYEINPDDAWTPIGYWKSNSDNAMYTGTFDGRGCVITGLTYNNDNTNYVGLFGYVGTDGDIKGTVQNVGLEDGSITGRYYVGGVAGNVSGAVTNCYNTGSVSGYSVVGGVAGHVGDSSTVTNCYNTGTVSGSSLVGGVAGDVGSGGAVTNCYNTGGVSGDSAVGGVVGFNYGSSAKVINCYNTGGVSGSSNYVGGVVGGNDNGTVSNCYYDKISGAFGAINGADTDTVKGLTTAQMTGETALDNLVFAYTAPAVSPWLFRADSAENDWFYPHLRGFAWDSTNDLLDWPPKVRVTVTNPEGSDSVTYDGTEQKIDPVAVIVNAPVIPEGANVTYYQQTSNDWMKKEGAPTDPGTYRATIREEDGNTYDTYFRILEPVLDYTVTYQVKTSEDTWRHAASVINAGDYKRVITFTDDGYRAGHADIETEFSIVQKALTITAKDQTRTYTGNTQGEDGTAYEDPAQITQKVTITGQLAEGDTLASITLNGQGTVVSETGYEIKPSAASIQNADGEDVTANYNITYLNGKLTITKADNPAVIASAATVTVGGNTVDLKDKVTEAVGTVSYSITGDAKGCGLSGSVLTSGDETGDVTVTVTVGESKNYKGATGEITVTVTDKAANDLTVTQSGATFGQTLAAPDYTEPDGTQSTSVSYSGTKRDGSAYGPSPSAPTDAGSYAVTVTCETSDTVYTGTATFTIAPASIADAVITLGTGLTYTGKEQTQTVEKIEPYGVNITSECTVSNNTATDAGSYTLTVTAKDTGNYTGTVTWEFVVAQADKTALDEKIKEAETFDEGIKENYPDISGELETALEDARQVLGDPNVDEETVSDALDALNDALELAQDKKTFEDAKDDALDEADRMAEAADSDASKQLIEEAKDKIEALAYDESAVLDDNLAAIEVILDELADKLAAQRDADDRQAFDEYKDAAAQSVSDLAEDGDSEACKQLIEEAVEEIEALGYDGEKTLEENKQRVDDILDKLVSDLAEQRAKDADGGDRNDFLLSLIRIGQELRKRMEEARRAAEAGREQTPEIPTLPAVPAEDEWVNPFRDVHESDPFYDDVKFVCQRGIMNGVADDLFDPDGSLTRGMIVTVLYRMEGKPAVPGVKIFTDVPSGEWYSDAVEWAATAGIVNGYGDGTYGPKDELTREQLAAILYRYAQYKGYEVEAGGADDGGASEWAAEYVKWAASTGVLVADESGELRPTETATRAEIAEAIRAFLENTEE